MRTHTCTVTRSRSGLGERDDGGHLDGFKRLTIVYIGATTHDGTTVHSQILMDAHEMCRDRWLR